MTNHGNVLQTFNTELEKSLESIYERRDNVALEIKKEQDKQYELESQRNKIKNELIQVDAYLQSKYEMKNDFDKVIYNSESAFKKILENSKTLMNIVKKEEATIIKRIEESR
jgi:Sjoegren syndrome nuclear autoantigen 1